MMNQMQQNEKAANPAIGAEIEGGYFAGQIMVDGKNYGVVVAPKDGGDLKGPWGERGKLIDNASHLSDGLTNTKAMAAAGSQIASSVLGIELNGHTDWYIPSRDELELVYRNLKPGTEENYCTFRDGENPNSVPQGLLYTEENPAQTSVDAFQEDGDEALEEAWYWSSTQYSAGDAFVQDFEDGHQGLSYEDDEWRVRAVRRFLID